MGRRKFINKKTAETFKVVFRSQHDPKTHAEDAAPKAQVLVPVGGPQKDSKLELPQEVLPSETEIGMDMNQKLYMLAPDIDPEILDALENAEEYDEIDDDFILQANQEGDDEEDEDYDDEEDEEEDEDEEEEEEEDWVLTKKKIKGQFDDIDDDEDDEEPEDGEEIDEDDEDDEDDEIDLDGLEGDEAAAKKPKAKPKKVPRSQQLLQLSDFMRKAEPVSAERAFLDTRFEKLLEAYDDDELGDLDGEDPAVLGASEINKYDDVIDDYLRERDELKTLPQFHKEEVIAYCMKAPEHYEIVEVEDEEKEQWNVHSITSTYTNTENHPRLIEEPSRRPQGIKLSHKTGLPLGVLPTKKPKKVKEPIVPVNKGDSRKAETLEEKKLRKKQVKEERKTKRENKKALKTAFKQEEITQMKAPKTMTTFHM
eukprot:TRINITY_DN11279_c0_g1_i1.p1 TRINITY_DN11279_c0_g1~~TRINITY_DN11279_c0_g1_i1.p1  ORF type:complete len:425 (+),score=142.85 TRINITY_DN11279_c0_g1_i1:50-1324(+)